MNESYRTKDSFIKHLSSDNSVPFKVVGKMFSVFNKYTSSNQPVKNVDLQYVLYLTPNVF